MKKKCDKCYKIKNETSFYLRDKETGARRNICKVCLRVRAKKNAKLYFKKLKGNKRKYSQAVKRKRAHYFKTKYSLDYGQLESMLKKQNGACQICQKGINLKTCKVDHCHKRGHVRGLLCNACNLALGIFKDNVEALKRAIRYLRKNI